LKPSETCFFPLGIGSRCLEYFYGSNNPTFAAITAVF
jgi:hypothetical protein